MVSGSDGTRQRRTLVDCYAAGLDGPIRAPSPRQLPTNHDYDGEAPALIHEYQSDQPSTRAAPAADPWCLIEGRR
jgi:hypothetical protein